MSRTEHGAESPDLLSEHYLNQNGPLTEPNLNMRMNGMSKLIPNKTQPASCAPMHKDWAPVQQFPYALLLFLL